MSHDPAARGPAYRIETPRLVIRCWNPEDAPLLQEAVQANVEHLRPWMPWVLSEPEELQVKIDRLREFRGKFDLGQDYYHAIFNADESRVLGGTGFHMHHGPNVREIGYWIDKDHLRQGLATEVAAAMTKVAFEVDRVERVEIHCDPENTKSAAVPRKLGFEHEATLRNRVLNTEGVLRGKMIWTMFPDEFASSPCASVDINAFDVMGRRLL